MNTAEILNLAADLLEPPGAWTQNNLARNKDGQAVHPWSSEATCWCPEGAIDAANKRVGGDAAQCSVAFYEACAYIARNTKHGFLLFRFNDAIDRTQAEVVAALRAAAKEVTNGEA